MRSRAAGYRNRDEPNLPEGGTVRISRVRHRRDPTTGLNGKITADAVTDAETYARHDPKP